jgi:hypothetical protein
MRPHPLLLAILAVLPACSETLDTEGCVAVDEDVTTCPAASDVSLDEVFLTSLCGDDIELVSVNGVGQLRNNPAETVGKACCYTAKVIDHDPGAECAIGRPFIVGDAALTAPARLSTIETVNLAAQTAETNAAQRALAWAQAGAGEHASIAAFGRLSLQLMAVGAPLDLLEGVQRAALDEVHHARACWDVAGRLSGAKVEVDAFPFEGAIDVQTTLADLAYAAVREGCLAETLGACVTKSVASLANDDVRSVLMRLADEEAGHAVLSFRIVSWALQLGGDSVREAVLKALTEPWPTLDAHELAVRSGVSHDVVVSAARSARTQVLEPAARALLS